MDTPFTPQEQRELLALHLPALQAHVKEITETPELNDAPLPPVLGHIYGGAIRRTLGDMLRCWTGGEETPWRFTNAEGHLCYRFFRVYGLSGCLHDESLDTVTRHLIDDRSPIGFTELLRVLTPHRRKPACDAPLNLTAVLRRVVPTPRLIVNIPHASVALPKHGGLSIPRAEQERLARYSADLYTDELAPADSLRVIAPLSRLIVDTERFADDVQEPAAAVGAGAVPTRAFDGTFLREHPSERRRAKLLRGPYRRHHEALRKHVRFSLAVYGTARLLDLHSYPESYDMPGMVSAARPDVCIGFEACHCPAALAQAVAACARRHGFSAALNEPFAGSLVPLPYYKNDPRVLSLMLELKRSCYMDERTLLPHSGMERVKEFVAEAAELLRNFPPCGKSRMGYNSFQQQRPL